MCSKEQGFYKSRDREGQSMAKRYCFELHDSDGAMVEVVRGSDYDALETALRRMVDAAVAFQDAVNLLWWAQNPEERAGVPPSEEHATEVHSECFTALTRHVYQVRKDFGFKANP